MLYFLLYLFIETFVSVNIASAIGPLWTFLEIIASAVYGFWILQSMHLQMMATMELLAKGEISVEEFEKMNLATFIGAILLIIPGFFTDILGILLQFGVLSNFIAKKILKLRSKKKEDDNVIDVEIIER